MFIGGLNVTTQICIGSISLHRINRLPFYQDTGAPIKVNQIGYLANGPKIATLVSQSTSPIGWTLQDSTGLTVASGLSAPFGNDMSSGLNVHTIEFSSYCEEGSDFLLTTGIGASSYPFSISSNLYEGLRQDSMQFFYQQRSGIAIDPQLVGTQYARPAGHLQIYPNQVIART